MIKDTRSQWDSNNHLFKVDIDSIVQDALTVCFIHHDQRVHLEKRKHTQQNQLKPGCF